jgi:hypothetical protein
MDCLWGGSLLSRKSIKAGSDAPPAPRTSVGKVASSSSGSGLTGDVGSQKLWKEFDKLDTLLLQGSQTLNNLSSDETVMVIKPKTVSTLADKVRAKLTTELKVSYTDGWVPGDEKTRGVKILDALCSLEKSLTAACVLDTSLQGVMSLHCCLIYSGVVEALSRCTCLLLIDCAA